MDKRAENLGLMHQLVQVARSDRKLHGAELSFLKRLGNMLELGQDEMERAFSDEPIDFVPPSLEHYRLLQFYRMVLIMNVNLQVEDAEMQLVRNMGTKMGLSAVLIEAVFDEMKKAEGGIIPEEKLVSIFRSVNN